MPPGVSLCELLDALPVQGVSGYDSVEVLAGAYRQLCRQQAVFYEAMVETGLRTQGSASMVARLSAPGEFSCEEARAKLVWSRQRAQADYVLGYALFVRQPSLGAALKAGRLDLPRARAFITWTEGLTDAQAGQVIDQLLPQAAGMVTGALVDHIKRACLAIDPEWAARKYKAAVKTRTVRGYRNADGTANLGGYAQPVDRVAAACARIDHLARACKRAGDRRTIDLIRSDLYLRMLDGTFEAMTDAEIVAHVRTNPLNDHTDTPDPTDGDPDGGDPGGHSANVGDADLGDSDTTGDAGPDDDNDGDPDDGNPDDGNPGGTGGLGDRPNPGAGGAGGPGEADSRDADEPEDPGPGSRSGAGGADGAGSSGADAPTVSSATQPRSVTDRPSVHGYAVPELRVQLTTLLGHDDHPAHLPGWDYVPAWLARHLVAGMESAQWRWVVCGPDGHPISGGLTSARPATAAHDNTTAGGGRARVRRDHRRGGIVELAIFHEDLNRLRRDPAASGPWEPVITDIGNSDARGDPDAGRDRASPDAGPDTGIQHSGADGRRTPGARLRRWIQLRDRTCAHPCCRAPASTTDIDHRIRWHDGGPTVATNLSPACRHDHRLKDEGGWHTRQPAPGITEWTSPLGQRTTSKPPPVIPKPVRVLPRDHHDRDWIPDNAYWPETCTCLVRPCPHTRSEPDNSEPDNFEPDNAGEAPDPASPIAPLNPDRPFTDWLRRSHRGNNPAIYDDLPPF